MLIILGDSIIINLLSKNIINNYDKLKTLFHNRNFIFIIYPLKDNKTTFSIFK